jgi:plastocyanin
MKKLVMATVTAVAMVAIASTGIKAAEPGKTVKVKGLESLEPNAIFLSNLKFAPGAIKVRTGDTVTWVDDARTAVPHTITIVNEAELPVDFAAAYTCLWDDVIPGVTGFCLQFLDAHGGPGGSTPVVDVGGPGLDTRADSLFLPPNGSVSAPVTAASGVLHYMCVIHPWMQGSIAIEEKGRK